MVAYLKAGPQVRNYSDYVRAAWEVEKEDSMELPSGPRTQTTENAAKPQATSFFPCGNQPTLKVPAVHLAYLEEGYARSDEDEESDDPS